MHRSRTIPAAFLLMFLPGCGFALPLLLFGGRPAETGSAKLIPFESQQELADYFADRLRTGPPRLDVVEEVTAGADSAAPPTIADGGAGGNDADATGRSFSQTTIQEEGVDEPDVVKTDGTYLYVLDGDTLRIVRAVPTDQLAEVATLTLDGFGRDLFLHDGKVVALTQTPGHFFGGGGIAIIEPVFLPETAVSSDAPVAPDRPSDEPVPFEKPGTIVTIIDATLPESPAVLSTTRFEGVATDSRLIDGVLHLVLSNFQSFFVDVLPVASTPSTPGVDLERILPAFRRTTADGTETTGDLVTWRELYHPTDPDGSGIVTVVSLDVDDNAAFSAVGIVAEPGLVYSSTSALYLTDTSFNFLGQTRETTDIYKFAYQGRGAVPSATGTVPGRILNQYSMGEFDNVLRVATSTFDFSFGRGTSKNHVFVLAQDGDTLSMVGSLTNLAPGETIQSARFIGPRGFLVTFERIDPLFTLDLADPTAPRVVGELKVPGFSTFILPIDADHLLAVGQYVPPTGPTFPQGVQLSIFDVSDFADPQRTANVILGQDNGAFSEALHNPKALTYLPERNLVTLPVSIFEGPSFDDVVIFDDPAVSVDQPASLMPQGFDGVAVFRVDTVSGIEDLGRVSTRFESAGVFGSSFTRGVLIGSDVLAVTNNGVRAAATDNLTAATAELLFERTLNAPIPVDDPIALPLLGR